MQSFWINARKEVNDDMSQLSKMDGKNGLTDQKDWRRWCTKLRIKDGPRVL